MKKGIHPEFFVDAEIKDNSSGQVFKIGSTVKSITVEISSLTHPFYTGKQRIVDTDNLVERFNKKVAKTDAKLVETRRKKKVARNKSSVERVVQKERLTLKDMLKSLK